MRIDPDKVMSTKRVDLVRMVQNNAMKNSKRKYLYAVPYNATFDMNNHLTIMINANDAGEALRKAKDAIKNMDSRIGKLKKKIKFIWGKPKKIRSNPKYKA